MDNRALETERRAAPCRARVVCVLARVPLLPLQEPRESKTQNRQNDNDRGEPPTRHTTSRDEQKRGARGSWRERATGRQGGGARWLSPW